MNISQICVQNNLIFLLGDFDLSDSLLLFFVGFFINNISDDIILEVDVWRSFTKNEESWFFERCAVDSWICSFSFTRICWWSSWISHDSALIDGYPDESFMLILPNNLLNLSIFQRIKLYPMKRRIDKKLLRFIELDLRSVEDILGYLYIFFNADFLMKLVFLQNMIWMSWITWIFLNFCYLFDWFI